MRLSILTATYNRSEVLRFAIESVRSQTFSDYEHIIIGDACTDDTESVVSSYNDPRIIFTNLPNNFGEQSVPNNAGFELAKGDLVAYLNHDDLWFPDHLERLVNFIDTAGADLVYALPISIDRHGMPFCGITNAEHRYDPSHFIPASLWLLRRELNVLLGGWRNSRQIDARNPSQDFLYRAWNLTRDLRCHPRITALILASGGRPDAYRLRDDSQHRQIFSCIQSGTYREELATDLAMKYARETASQSGWTAAANAFFDRLMVRLGLHPDSVRNRIAFRKRGWWIDNLREFRGLPPKKDRNGNK